jgi:hypothetical protein
MSAPTLSQIQKVIFAYLKVNKGLAEVARCPLPGRITETLDWKLDTEITVQEFLGVWKATQRPGYCLEFPGNS